MRGLKFFIGGLQEVVFPHICEICGSALADTTHFICDECVEHRFEYARLSGSVNNSEIILPENVQIQFALWRFDKGGYLQDLLHALKYHRLYGVGEDLGKALGQRLLRFSEFKKIENAVLVPVPLHKKKERKRGYNQAYYLAKGVGKVMGVPVVSKAGVERIKNTKTQTGFSLEKRKENISEAFQVVRPKEIEGKTCIIVDDVFTTGATTFELADVLENVGAGKIMIITVAEA